MIVSYGRSPTIGLTLIEVLAAISLLAGLLAMIVVSASRHTEQLRLAQDRLAAQQAADDLLQTWLLEQDGRIAKSRGPVPGRPSWRWRLTGRGEPGLEPLGLHIGALEIVRAERRAVAGLEAESVVLARIEFASRATATARSASAGP